MTSFVNLKSNRTQKDAKRSFVRRTQQETSDRKTQVDNLQQGDPMLVDLPDTPEISDIPESPITSGQSRSEIPSQRSECHLSMPPGLEVRSTETRGRNVWSTGLWRKGESEIVLCSYSF